MDDVVGRMHRAVMVLVAGCSGTAVMAPSSPPSPPPIAPSVPVAAAPNLAAMFAVPSPPVPETRCKTFPLPDRGSRGVVGGMRSVFYDFMEMPLGAVESGPRTSARERRVDPLTNNELHRPFARRANHIERCWKWFAATHPGGATQLDVRLTIDVFGATGAINIANRPEDSDLAACIRDAFVAPMYLYAPRSRERRTTTTLKFERADQPAWKKMPARPAPIKSEPLPERGSTCVRVVPGTVDARLYSLVVSDFDRSRIPPPPPAPRGMRFHVVEPPSLRVGCSVVDELPKKRDIRGSVKSNWGAYEACHAEARTRMPDLSGTVNATLVFDARGAEPTLAQVSGAGDAEFHACLDRALEEIWLDPPSSESLIVANFVFPLDTTPPAHYLNQAEWEAQLAQPANALSGCRERHDLVKDRLAAIPWIDDARVRAAFGELARYIATLSPADAKACVAEVDETLRTYTGVDIHSLSGDGQSVEAHLDRLEAVLPAARALAWGPNLRWMIALVYRKQPTRVAEGTRILEELMLDSRINDVVHVEERDSVLSNSCAM